MSVRHDRAVSPRLLAVLGIGALVAAGVAAAGDEECLECHATRAQVLDAASAIGVEVSESRAERLTVAAMSEASPHIGMACVDCHPKAAELPHPAEMLADNPCLTCHEDALTAVGKSAHRDPAGGSALRATCAACHGEHDVRRVGDPTSKVAPSHVAERCLGCHDKQEYLEGVHGHAVSVAGLDIAATCVSCHGGHDIQAHTEVTSRTARRNISFTCGK